MERGGDSTPMDPTNVRFRLRSVQAGAWLSVFCCASASLYYALTWGRADRLLVLSVTLATMFASLGLTRLPLDEMLRGRRREPFFLAWSFTVTAILCTIISLDGGVRSPLTAGLFLPLIFAALSYPLRSTIAVGVMVTIGYLLVAVGGGEDNLGFMAFWVCCLANATWMCAWQARNHDLHHA